MTPKRQKPFQKSFRVEPELDKRLRDAAKREDLKEADFIRKLVKWALEQYETVGNLHDLRESKITTPRKPRK